LFPILLCENLYKAKDEVLDRTVKRLERMNGFEQEVYIDSELGTQYFKPDKTGMADFALESAGGEIVSDWTSKLVSRPCLSVTLLYFYILGV